MKMFCIVIVTVISQSCAFNEEDINRIQYGIIFKRLTDFHPVSSHWFHTFSIKLPDLTKQDLIFTRKGGQQTNWKRCLMNVVSFIGDNRALLDRALLDRVQNGPEDNDTCNRHFRTITHLVRQNQISLASTNQLLTKIESLLPREVDTQHRTGRNSRAPLEFIGDISEFMFGTVSQKSYRKLTRHVKALSANQAAQTRVLQKSLKELSSFGRIVNDRIDLVVNATQKLAEEMTVEVNRFEEIIIAMDQQFQVFVDLSLRYMELIAVTERASRELTQFANGLENLKNRRLTVDLIPIQHMRDTLASIQETLTEAGSSERQYFLAHKDPEAYYNSKLEFIATRNGTFLMIGVHIPLTIYEFSFYAFEILSYPLHIPDNQQDMMYLEPQQQGIAVNEWPKFGNSTYKFLFLENDDILQLKINRGINTDKRTIQTNSMDLCLFAIYNDEPLQVRSKCNYQIHIGGMKPSIYYLGAARYYLVNIKQYVIRCQTMNTDKRAHNSDERFSCMNTCVVNLPDSCTLLSQDYRIDHAFDVATTESRYKEQYLASIPILMQFFGENEIKILGGSKLYNTKPQIRTPKFRFYSNPITDLLAEDAPKRISLGKAVDSIKKNEQIVGNLAESILIGQSKIQFPTQDESTIFRVSVGTVMAYILIIALIAQGIYCLYKIRMILAVLALLSSPQTARGQNMENDEDEGELLFDYFATTERAFKTPLAVLRRRTGMTNRDPTDSLDPHVVVSQAANTYWIYGVFFIILVGGSYLIYRFCLKKYCTKLHQERPITKIAFQFSRGNHTVLIPIVKAFSTPDDLRIVCQKWISDIQLDGCLHPKLSFFWEATIVDSFSGRTKMIPQSLPVQYWDAIKLNGIMRLAYAVKPVMVYQGRLKPIPFATSANGSTYQYADLLEWNNTFQSPEPNPASKIPRPSRRLLNVESEVTKVTEDQSCHQCETHNPLLRSENSQIVAVPRLEEPVEEMESE